MSRHGFSAADLLNRRNADVFRNFVISEGIQPSIAPAPSASASGSGDQPATTRTSQASSDAAPAQPFVTPAPDIPITATASDREEAERDEAAGVTPNNINSAPLFQMPGPGHPLWTLSADANQSDVLDEQIRILNETTSPEDMAFFNQQQRIADDVASRFRGAEGGGEGGGQGPSSLGSGSFFSGSLDFGPLQEGFFGDLDVELDDLNRRAGFTNEGRSEPDGGVVNKQIDFGFFDPNLDPRLSDFGTSPPGTGTLDNPPTTDNTGIPTGGPGPGVGLDPGLPDADPGDLGNLGDLGGPGGIYGPTNQVAVPPNIAGQVPRLPSLRNVRRFARRRNAANFSGQTDVILTSGQGVLGKANTLQKVLLGK